MGAIAGGMLQGYAQGKVQKEEREFNEKVKKAQLKMAEIEIEKAQRQQSAMQKLMPPTNAQTGAVAAPLQNAGQKPGTNISEMLAQHGLGTLLDAGISLDSIAKATNQKPQAAPRPFVVGGNLVDAEGRVIFRAPQKSEKGPDPFRGLNLPEGMMWSGSAPQQGMQPIPGFTPKSEIEAQEKAALDKKRADANIGTATNVIEEVDKALGKTKWWTTGLLGPLTSMIGGTDSRELAKALETVKANIGFDRLQQMREMSPTGVALGQVAVQELSALQNSISSLDQGQDDETLAANLNKVRTHYQNWKTTVEKANGISADGADSWLSGAQKIRQAYQQGKISKEEARERLKALNGG